MSDSKHDTSDNKGLSDNEDMQEDALIPQKEYSIFNNKEKLKTLIKDSKVVACARLVPYSSNTEKVTNKKIENIKPKKETNLDKIKKVFGF